MQTISWGTDKVLIERDVNSIKELVEIAVKEGISLAFAFLYREDLCEVNFRGADLRKADLGFAILKNADFRGADLRGANLEGADLRGADFRGAKCKSINLANADLRGTKF